jgi:hypothetical protein
MSKAQRPEQDSGLPDESDNNDAAVMLMGGEMPAVKIRRRTRSLPTTLCHHNWLFPQYSKLTLPTLAAPPPLTW